MMHHKEEKSSKVEEVSTLTLKILSAKLKENKLESSYPLDHHGNAKLERQLLMQNQMRERQTAMQIAWTREFLKYFGTFFGLAAAGLTAGAIKKKNPGVLLPIVPLSFIFAYQYDMGYGTLLQRIKGEAENILDTQSTLLELPKGPLTYEDLEKIRRSQSKFFIEK
ncbi:plasminogen receptor (KT) isoform X1 [Aptenodytes patagonicus]|uniref:plasminogen receptor (KT) isoform X1 n=1 Tax=Aptenodytes patagonicus TaxID=9234 RepID=UPI003F9F8ABF